jgi:hypothetical protein
MVATALIRCRDEDFGTDTLGAGPDRADNRTSHDVRTARLRDHDHREG